MTPSCNRRLMGRCVTLVVLAVVLPSCGPAERLLTHPPATARSPMELAQDPDGSFVFYVSNQSFAEPTVDIQVLIDGKTAVNHSFRVGDQHNWRKFVFALPQGKHTLKAVSSKGKAQLETEFTVGKKNWAVLDYWYSPENHDKDRSQRCFSFENRDKPIGFV